MLESFQNSHYLIRSVFKFLRKHIKTNDFNMNRLSVQIGQTIPKGRPVAPVLIGKIQRFLNDFVYFRIMIDVTEINYIFFSTHF